MEKEKNIFFFFLFLFTFTKKIQNYFRKDKSYQQNIGSESKKILKNDENFKNHWSEFKLGIYQILDIFKAIGKIIYIIGLNIFQPNIDRLSLLLDEHLMKLRQYQLVRFFFYLIFALNCGCLISFLDINGYIYDRSRKFYLYSYRKGIPVNHKFCGKKIYRIPKKKHFWKPICTCSRLYCMTILRVKKYPPFCKLFYMKNRAEFLFFIFTFLGRNSGYLMILLGFFTLSFTNDNLKFDYEIESFFLIFQILVWCAVFILFLLWRNDINTVFFPKRLREPVFLITLVFVFNNILLLSIAFYISTHEDELKLSKTLERWYSDYKKIQFKSIKIYISMCEKMKKVFDLFLAFLFSIISIIYLIVSNSMKIWIHSSRMAKFFNILIWIFEGVTLLNRFTFQFYGIL